MVRFYLQVCAYVIGLPLEALIIVAMFRGSYRRFPLVFAYMNVFFVTTIVETLLYLGAYGSKVRNPSGVTRYVKCYWFDERILLGLVFLLVVSLIYQATAKLRSRRIIRTILTLGALVFAGVTFGIHYDSALGPGEWMTPWTSDLNFCAAVLDLFLWTMLAAAKEKDHQILLLSGGLGIQFTGEAIGEAVRYLSLRNHSAGISFAGGVVIILANLTFLYVWLQALRLERKALRATA